jgi:NADPH:quinone reductase-like Zn-dependent oxidoreductase
MLFQQRAFLTRPAQAGPMPTPPGGQRGVFEFWRPVGIATGGVGLIARPWLNAIEATVIGVVGSDEEATIAREHGCLHVVVSTREDIAGRVRAITGEAGVPVVCDWVGKDTFLRSLDYPRPRGRGE